MNLILYHKAGGLSAPRLASFMGIESARVLKEPVDCLIRWGLATKVPTPGREINSREALVRYFTRFKQLELLKASEVSVPLFSTTANVGFPMLGRNEGRKGRQSTKGRGITYYPELTRPDHRHSFFMRFYPKQRQFRVHVIGKSTRTRELIANSPKCLDQPVWNFDAGFTYRNLQKPRPEGVIPQARRAVQALQLDFGAVDIIVHDKTPYVLEVNTAPGLGDLTLAWYAHNLGRLVGMDLKTMPGLKEVSDAVDN